MPLLSPSLPPSRRPGAVVLHSIDGPGLQSAEGQALLAELCHAGNVRFVASFDDVDTPLLWDRE